MKELVVWTAALLMTSCSYPRYTKKEMRSFRSDIAFSSWDELTVSSYHFSAGQRMGGNRIIADTLKIIDSPDSLILPALRKFGFTFEKLINDPSLAILIDPEIRWQRRKLRKFLEQQDFADMILVPIVCYNAGLEPERSGGGGIGPVHRTGNDRYFIAHELYIAIYQNHRLIFLRRVIRLDEKIVPSGTPITHEFPQEVLDSLMQMALEPLLKQLDRNK